MDLTASAPSSREAGPATSVTALAATAQSHLAVGTSTGLVQVLRVESAGASLLSRLGGRPETAVFEHRPHTNEPVARMVAAAMPAGGTVLCTQAPSGEVVTTPVSVARGASSRASAPPSTTAVDAAFLDGGLVVAGAAGRQVWTWAAEADATVRLLDAGADVRGIALFPATRERLMAFGTPEGDLRVACDDGRLTELASVPAGAVVTAVKAWAGRDGQTRLAVAVQDGTVTLWTFDHGARSLTRNRPLSSRTAAAVEELSVHRGLLAARSSAHGVTLWELDGHRSGEVAIDGDVSAIAALRFAQGLPAVGWVSAQGEPTVTRVELAEPGRARPRILVGDDRPATSTEQDLLGFGSYVRALSVLIANRDTATPLSIAIDAEWGAGKTSLGHMVDTELGRSSPSGDEVDIVPVWFNAWSHDQADDLATSMASVVAAHVQPHRPWWRRVVSPIPPTAADFVHRHARVLGALVAVLLGAVLVARPPWLRDALDTVDVKGGPTLVSVGGLSLSLGAVRLVALLRGRFSSAIEAFLRASDRVAIEGRIGDVRAELGRRIADATRPIPDRENASRLPGLDRLRRWARDGAPRRPLRVLQLAARRVLGVRRERRVVLFVDDLDRCRPEHAVQACETMTQLLDHRRLVTVVLADLPALTASAEVVFSDLAERTRDDRGAGRFGRRFLDKVFQFEFTIPAHRPGALRALLAAGVGVAPDAPPAPERAGPAAEDGSPAEGYGDLPAITPPAPPAPVTLAAGLGTLAGLPYPGAATRPPASASPPWITSEAVRSSVSLAAVLAIPWLIGRVDPLWLKVLVGVGGLLAVGVLLALPTLRELRAERPAPADKWVPSLATPWGGLSPPAPGGASEPMAASPPVPLRRDVVRAVLRDSDHLELGRRQVELWLRGASPRTAKRLANRLMFTIAVATDRQLLLTESPIDGVVIGKWVTVMERWPEVAGLLRTDPRRFLDLEARARRDELPAFVRTLEEDGPAAAAPDQLRELLRADPRLGAHAEQLVQLAQ